MNSNNDPKTDRALIPAGIVETNNLPIILMIVLVVVLTIGFMFRPEPQQKKETAEDQKIAVGVKTQDGVQSFWFNDDEHKKIQINLLEAVNSPEALQRSEQAVVTAQETKYKQAVVELEYAKKVELAQMQKKHELEEQEMAFAAMKAPLDIETGRLPPVRAKTEQALPARGQPAARGMALPSAPQNRDNLQDAKESFLNKETGQEEYLSSFKKAPLSPFELKAGTYIPAALVTGIQSDLPGPIVAQVTANVYDTSSGQYLLIPQGAKLVGEYDSHVSFGQNRALVVWTRLVFPDAATLNLERMQGVDMAGYAGFYDKVDNHYLRIYANAFMLSLVGAGYELLNKTSGSSDSPSAGDTVAANVGQRLADVSSQTMERNLNVQPTIVIRAGYQFNVVVVKDVILEDISHDAP